ncbi:uncharacterized protein I206_106757 [Kwoniella pini CBS 10737]|uniref:Haloacid dehalogenase, type II n=1 Tax=Kwoniella pini CBS 10737 TaxID=1296096 RepID=A0A1B9HTA2_9TREE|nr:uncharacterized protein I206_07355 [Kwoniella pini CBS 10737]OCF46502.1 hypothetical protein I206_07355 [Kwoniella pini CBS 10737]
MSSTSAKKPVRLVLFDVFDTLCTPKLPIHEQYYDEAIKGGLSPGTITPLSVRSAFKPAFRAVNADWPLYGKHTHPALTPEEWWTKIIYQTLLEAGASSSELNEKIGMIGPALMSRFESDKGYKNFPETIDCLKELRRLEIKTSIISNADPRILKTLDSLDILPLLTYPPTLSWDVEHAKPSPEIYNAACAACEASPGEGVIMVGDELKADYRGSVTAGLEGRLIRREGEWSDGAVRVDGEDLSGVRVIKSLNDVLAEIQARRST